MKLFLSTDFEGTSGVVAWGRFASADVHPTVACELLRVVGVSDTSPVKSGADGRGKPFQV